MWNQKINKRISNILQLISDMPNVRPHPTDRSIQVFDGGVMRVTTGITSYEFADGTTAIYGTGLNIGLTIMFPGGERVTVSSSHTYCGACLGYLAADARYCQDCGQENPNWGREGR